MILHQKHGLTTLLALLIALILMSGCGGQVAGIQEVEPTNPALTKTEVPTSTNTPSPTNTSTATPTPTDTPIPTPTPFGGGAGKIVFTSFRNGSEDVWIMDSDGNNQTLLMEMPDDYIYSRWTSDRKSIIILTGNNYQRDIYIGEIESGNISQITEDFGLIRSVYWDLKEEKIIFSSDITGTFSLWMIDPDGNNLNQLSDGTIGEVQYLRSWKPLGESFLFCTGSLWNGPNDVWQLNPYTMEFTQIIRSNGERIVNSWWSPDGEYIYYSSNKNGVLSIWRMKPDGSEDIQLTPNELGEVYGGEFSPDETKISFTASLRGSSDIWIMDLDGSNLVQVTTSKAEDYIPSWSIDSRLIFFSSDRTGNQDIFRINSDGTNLVQLTTSLSEDRGSYLSPDGTWIVYRSSDNKNYDLSIMDIDGNNQMQLTTDLADDYMLFWMPAIDE